MERKAWAVRGRLDRQDSETRGALLRAARAVFGRQGYTSTTIGDIAGEAAVSRATFYVYFATKEEVFRLLAEQVRDRFRSAQDLTGIDPSDPRAVAGRTIATFLDAYVEDRPLVVVMEHQPLTDPHLHGLWHEIHSRPVRRTTRWITELVQTGGAAPAAAPESVARAAAGMTAHFAAAVAADPTRRTAAVADLTAMFLTLLGLPPDRKD